MGVTLNFVCVLFEVFLEFSGVGLGLIFAKGRIEE